MTELDRLQDAFLKADALAQQGDQQAAQDAKLFADEIRRLQGPPQTNNLDQFGSGLNEGVAIGAGSPVEYATALINGLVRHPTYSLNVTPTDGGIDVQAEQTGMTPGIDNPVGGVGTFMNALDPLISDAAPQNRLQRYLRRGGQEIGAGAVMAPAMAALPGVGAPARASMPTYMAVNAAGDVGSAVAGQTAEEIAPGNNIAQIVASLVGGVAGSAIPAAMINRYMPGISTEDLKARAKRGFDAMKENAARMNEDATSRLQANTRSAISGIDADDADLFPKTSRLLDKVDEMDAPTINDVVRKRRLVGRTAAKDPNETFAGVTLKGEMDDFLKGLTPDDFRRYLDLGDGQRMAIADDVGDPQDAIEAYLRANDDYARASRAEEVEFGLDRAGRQAAKSGVGGNEVNTIRQRIDQILNRELDPTRPGRSSGYTDAEIAAMREIVEGGNLDNFMRRVGRMSPTSNTLAGWGTGIGGTAGITGALATGQPWMAIPAVVGGAGALAKGGAEMVAKRRIAELLELIRSGGDRVANPAKDAAMSAIVQQLLRPATE